MLNTQLHDQLLNLLKKDQSASQLNETEYKKIYADNTNILKKIINQYGLPTISLVGQDGNEAAWFIAQHSDHDINFQKRCLLLLSAAFKKQNEPKHHIAYLQDRISLNENRPQKFGTQIRYNHKTKQHEPYPPVESPERLDQLRMEHNLPPLDQYIDILSKFNKD